MEAPSLPPGAPDWSSHYHPAEWLELERRWHAGELLPHLQCLLVFVERHAGEFAEPSPRPDAAREWLADLKRAIFQRGTVNRVVEMRAQAQEVRNAIWYAGERGDHDRGRVAHDWAAQHASAWRRWRLVEYCYVADRCTDLLAARIVAAQRQTRSPARTV